MKFRSNTIIAGVATLSLVAGNFQSSSYVSAAGTAMVTEVAENGRVIEYHDDYLNKYVMTLDSVLFSSIGNLDCISSSHAFNVPEQGDVAMLAISSEPVYANYTLESMVEESGVVGQSTLEEWFYSDSLGLYVADMSYLLDAGDYSITVEFQDTVPSLFGFTAGYGSISATEIGPLSFSESDVSITKGFSQKLTVQGASSGLLWHSSNSKIATVNSNGTVAAKKKGNTTIVASTPDGKFASCTVNVVDNVYRGNRANSAEQGYGVFLNAYTVKYAKNGDLVATCDIINNYSHRVLKVKNVSFDVFNVDGKKIGTCKLVSKKLNLGIDKTCSIIVKCKKSKLKIKKTQDLRKISFSVPNGKYVYSTSD